MIAVIQRVLEADVKVDGNVCGKIDKGLVVFLGVKAGDSEKDAELLANKIGKLRIFSDENDKMNLSVTDVSGKILAISNFTLLANYKKGNRPDYLNAEKPERANELYEYFCNLISSYVPVEKGIFGEDMKINALNDGPITIVMDSEVLK
jgi:D-tyrosyl-tRNA(Tyr) deacylase